MPYRTRIAFLILGLGVLVAGAQVDSQVPVQASVVGTYQLATVNGSPLPVVVEEEEGCREELTGATLTLREDGRWVLQSTTRETRGQRSWEEQDDEWGRYTVEGRTIRFDFDEDRDDDDREIDIDDLEVGTLDANALTIRLEDGRTTVVFRR